MVLITGATGFIGSRLTRFLSEKGYDVKGINEEITDIEKLRPHFKDAEFVVHLAAKIPNSKPGSKANDIFQVNVGGTMNVVKLCLEYGCKLIFLSSSATQSEYGISKVLAQELVRSYARYYGLQAVVVRPVGIYDEDDWSVPYINKLYPLGRLVSDIENIIAKHDFRIYKVFETKTWRQKAYFIKRKIHAFKKRFK